MRSTFSVSLLVTSAGLAACSPVANPIVEGMGGPQLDGAGGASVVPDGAPDARDAAVEVRPPICGNGEREDDEVCDDFRNPTKGFGCDDKCGGPLDAVCNDGVVTSPEVCDGPAGYCDKCTKIVGSCGDGVQQSPMEECDAKGESATCDADCTHVACGDQIVNRAAKEICDDGLNDGQPGSCATDCSDYVAKPADAMFSSCRDLLMSRSALGRTRSGFYYLRGKDAAAYVAYCDMTSEGGGWTLVMRAIESNFDYYDPLWSSATFENETLFDFVTKKTRSKYRPYVEVPFNELRTSELPVDLSVGYVAAVPPQASALAFFSANGGEGVGVTIGSGPDALEPYFNARANPDDRQWGCDQFIHVGTNQHALLKVKDMDDSSLGAGSGGHCDWDGGARFGQRVNTCHYAASGHECSGNHGGQGWGNFNNVKLPLQKAKPITQLLWVR